MDAINTIANGTITVEEVRNRTYATGGNGCCTRQVEWLIECIHSTD
jgi:NAD(P)H-nitrite reductase large subunit